jgi:phosphate transport system substrate-binding protein
LAQSTWWRTPLFVLFALIVSGAQTGCDSAKTSQTISIDGSSTVYPLSRAIAKASGTGGGFKKFCTGQLEIADASRPINSSESELCKAQHIEYIELPVAFDSLSVVVNAKNTFVECLSVKELRSMWEPAAEGKVCAWQQIRPSFPAKPLALFSPGKDSGTFDYFTLAIVGTEGQSRGDVVRSEDDLVIERGVAADPNAVRYFGYAYYQANSDKVKLVAVGNGHGCVASSVQTVADTTYQPLSRPYSSMSTWPQPRARISRPSRTFISRPRTSST